jgi:hypothetical protein
MDAVQKKNLIELVTKAKQLGKNSGWVTYCMLSSPCKYSREAFAALGKMYGYKPNWAVIKHSEYVNQLDKRAKQTAAFNKGLKTDVIDSLADELATAAAVVSIPDPDHETGEAANTLDGALDGAPDDL